VDRLGDQNPAAVATTALHRMEAEDHVQALLRLANGAPGLLNATTASYPGAPERIEISGTLGAARLVGGALTLSFHDGAVEHVAAEGGTGSGANIMDFPHDAHRAVIADMLAAVRDDRPPAVSAESALATQRLIDAILVQGGGRRTGG
jgi:predicted dehydrogenase